MDATREVPDVTAGVDAPVPDALAPDTLAPDTSVPDAGPWLDAPEPPVPPVKSAKRGIAYNLADPADFAALSAGVSWWYNWSPSPSSEAPPDVASLHGMDFVPMMWNFSYESADIEALLLAQPQIKHLLVLNEPNLIDQANMSPAAVADQWPKYEAIAAATGVKIVGPAITWGTVPEFADPVIWMDAFYAAYAEKHGGEPQIDALAFHWYDYGLAKQLDRLTKYGKPFWVTEFANWHGLWQGADGAEIDSPAKQMTQMTELVAVCESRVDVERYAWFTGRWDDDPMFTSLLGEAGELTVVGEHYLGLPFGL